MCSRFRRTLPSVILVLAGCSDDYRRHSTPTAPEPPSAATAQPTASPVPPQPTPSPTLSGLEGHWSGTAAIEEITNPFGRPMDDCVSAALRSRFAGRLEVALVIEPGGFRFVEVPASFGACEGGYGPLLVGDWDIWCDFQIPFEISCEDGESRTLYYPNLEDDLGFDIDWRGDDAITFPFTEVFSPSFGSTRLTDPLYYVTFRFELRR